MYEVKTKALIGRAVTVQLTCSFVFAYPKSRFSEDVAHIVLSPQGTPIYSYLEQPLIFEPRGEKTNNLDFDQV